MKKIKIFPLGVEAKICSSFFSKAKGMMFLCKAKKAKPVLFVFNHEQYIPIHMFFVFFPLLIIWLDEEKRVVDFEIMKPFSYFSPKIKSKYILEVPFLKSNKKLKSIVKKLKIGMQVRFRR